MSISVMFTACSAAPKWTKNKSGLTDYNVTQPQKNATELFLLTSLTVRFTLAAFSSYATSLDMFSACLSFWVMKQSVLWMRDIKKISTDNVRAAESRLL